MSLDQVCVNTIRALAMDAVEQANSGHPGTPMAMAPGTLWQPRPAGGVKAVDPDYERLGELSVTLDDSKRFRQLDSKCPGRAGSGIETTAGPLGQGVAISVGMGKAVSRRRRT